MIRCDCLWSKTIKNGGSLKQGLREHGYAVDLVTEGVRRFNMRHAMLTIADPGPMLLGRDGLDVLRSFETKGQDAGNILMPRVT